MNKGNSITEIAARLLMEDESGDIQRKNLQSVYLADENDDTIIDEDGELLDAAPGSTEAASLAKGAKRATEPQDDSKSRSSSTKVTFPEDTDEIEINFDEESDDDFVNEDDEKLDEASDNEDDDKPFSEDDDFPNLYSEEDEDEKKVVSEDDSIEIDVDEEDAEKVNEEDEDDKKTVKESSRRRSGRRLSEDDEKELDEEDDEKELDEEDEDDSSKKKPVSEESDDDLEEEEDDDFEIELDDLGEDDEQDKKSMNESIKALVGKNLDEEFRGQATSLFESYVNKRVHNIKVKLFEQFKDIAKKRFERYETKMVGKIDGYLTYVVEEWLKENKIALRRSIRSEIAEEFIGKLKKVMNECNFDVPVGKRNLLVDVTKKAQALKNSLNEEIEKNTKLTSTMKKLLQKTLVSEESASLTDIQKNKLNQLIEGFEFDGVDSYRRKIRTVINEHFTRPATTNATRKVRDVLVEGNVTGNPSDGPKLDREMQSFADACSRIGSRNKRQ